MRSGLWIQVYPISINTWMGCLIVSIRWSSDVVPGPNGETVTMSPLPVANPISYCQMGFECKPKKPITPLSHYESRDQVLCHFDLHLCRAGLSIEFKRPGILSSRVSVISEYESR